MNKEELKTRKRFRQNYLMDKKYFDKVPYTELEKFHLKNIKILEEYEKNEK